LLVDCDTQSSASEFLGFERPEKTIADCIVGEAPANECFIEAREFLWLFGGGYGLLSLKTHLSRMDGPERLSVMKDFFANEGFGILDYVVFDCAPGWDLLSLNILAASDEIITPVSLEEMTIRTLPRFISQLRAGMTINPGLSLKYILPTFYDRRVKKSSRHLETLQERYGSLVCDPIRYNVRLSEAPESGKSIFESSPRSTGASDYQSFADHVIFSCQD